MQEQELQKASDACDAGDTHTHTHTRIHINRLKVGKDAKLTGVTK